MYKEIGSEGTSWLYELSANETTYNISSPLLADFKYFGRWIVMNHRSFTEYYSEQQDDGSHDF